MIEQIKKEMETHIGDKVKIVFNSGRNKIEEFEAVVIEVYNSIFVVRLNNEFNEIKSFTFSDILTQTVEVYYE